VTAGYESVILVAGVLPSVRLWTGSEVVLPPALMERLQLQDLVPTETFGNIGSERICLRRQFISYTTREDIGRQHVS